MANGGNGPLTTNGGSEQPHREFSEYSKTEQFALLNFALNRVQQAAVLIDERGRFRYVNDEACRILGYAKEELLRLGVADIDPEWPQECWPERWEQLKAAGSRIFESRHKTREGRIFPVEISANHFEFEGRGYLLALSQDITERKHADERLKMLDQALNRIREPAYIINRDNMQFLYVNDEACRALGYSRDELLGLTVYDIDPDYTLEKAADVKRQADTLGMVTLERRHRAKDGRIFPVEVNTSVFEYEGKRVSIALSRDITERKRMEAALRESERHFRSLVENWPDEIARYDRNCRRTYINPAMTGALGPAKILLGKTPTETYPSSQDMAFYEQKLREVMETGATAEFELGWGFPVSHPRYRLMRVIPERDENGAIVGAFAIARDITERKRAEEELQRLNTTLEQRIREALARNREKDLLLIQQSRLAAMGEMVHNIAHHWRQPLNAVALLMANIRDSYQYGELTQENLDDMVDKGEQIIKSMSATIDDFRDFFRPDEKKRDFPIAKCLRKINDILGASLGSLDIDLINHVGDDITVNGFESEFSQVLINLIDNAKEAIIACRGKGGHIEIDASLEDRAVVLKVTDDGGGIPEAILPKIFDPYFTTRDKGSGIGLYMNRMIIENKMGGKIQARNTANGAEFIIRLPASATA
ncbi:MAG: PAS domain S-box protein [Sulfuricellaceae bacterium]|jgi:PAS domain S-box-containing protein